MRSTKLLRQGHTIYIANVYWDPEQKFYYGKVNACFITSTQTIGGVPCARYEVNETLSGVGSMPVLQRYTPRDRKNTTFFHKKYFSTRNRALKYVQHHAMLLNHSFTQESTTQND